MGHSNYDGLILSGVNETPQTTTVKVFLKDENNRVLLAKKISSVPSGESGFTVGGFLIDAGGTGEEKLLVNRGTVSSCSFQPLNVIDNELSANNGLLVAADEKLKLGDSDSYIMKVTADNELVLSTDETLVLESTGGLMKSVPSEVSEVEEAADGTIGSKRLCIIDASGDLIQADVDSINVAGINNEGEPVNTGEPVALGLHGHITGVADAAIEGGTHLKSCSGGRVGRFITSTLAGTTMKTQATAGAAFGNQPANDGLEILSDNSADTGINVTVIGTTQGTDTVVEEVIPTDGTDGTTPVSTVKTDWGIILAVKSDAHSGTLTVREASADQAVVTLAAGVNSAGVIEVTGDAQRAFNKAPVIVSDSATTKQIGIKGQGTDYSSLYDSQALTGATAATMNSAFNLVEEIYVGDLEAARTITVKVGAADDFSLLVGRAGPAGAGAKDEDVIVII